MSYMKAWIWEMGCIWRLLESIVIWGDMLNGGGGADSASVARVRCAWRKFKEVSGILTRKEVSLKLKGKVHVTCVRSAKVYGSDTWAMNVEQSARLERTEMKIVRWMFGVSLRNRLPSAELRERMGIELCMTL